MAFQARAATGQQQQADRRRRAAGCSVGGATRAHRDRASGRCGKAATSIAARDHPQLVRIGARVVLQHVIAHRLRDADHALAAGHDRAVARGRIQAMHGGHPTRAAIGAACPRERAPAEPRGQAANAHARCRRVRARTSAATRAHGATSSGDLRPMSRVTCSAPIAAAAATAGRRRTRRSRDARRAPARRRFPGWNVRRRPHSSAGSSCTTQSSRLAAPASLPRAGQSTSTNARRNTGTGFRRRRPRSPGTRADANSTTPSRAAGSSAADRRDALHSASVALAGAPAAGGWGCWASAMARALRWGWCGPGV